MAAIVLFRPSPIPLRLHYIRDSSVISSMSHQAGTIRPSSNHNIMEKLVLFQNMPTKKLSKPSKIQLMITVFCVATFTQTHLAPIPNIWSLHVGLTLF